MDIFKIRDNFEEISRVETTLIYSTNSSSKEMMVTRAIPTYKRASTLKETLDSALHQVCEHDYRIIVVDNDPERNDETEELRFPGKCDQVKIRKEGKECLEN